jgi:integrase
MKLATLAWTTAATVAAAAAGGAATDPNSGWYLRLRKPGWQPPALAFPVVWTALYADLAVSSAVALDSAATKDVTAGRNSTAAGTTSTNSEGNTPGAPLRATDIIGLQQIGTNTLRLLEVCAAAEMLEDDREPAVDKWFSTAIAELPEQMRSELRRWYTVMTDGSNIPPRSKPRTEQTIRLYLRWSLPALQAWAASGHTTLREITTEDVREVLPGSGNPRAAMGQGLRCLFRVLKGHRVIFYNPIGPIQTGTHETRQPMPLASALLREAFNSEDPARAALTAIVAFHGLRSGQLRNLKLTDIRDGRLHLDDRIIPLPQPVRDRLAAWLSYREQRWPITRNPHVFVSRRSAIDISPVGVQWITTSMGMTTQEAREDRILHELHASGGDIRRLCDMFGLSIAGASRYAAALTHPSLQNA